MAGQSILTKRRISHAEAQEAFKRFENLFWKRDPGPRVGIPARPDYDDDLILSAYFRQQEEADSEHTANKEGNL